MEEYTPLTKETYGVSSCYIFFQTESYSRGALWFSNSLYCLPYNSYDVCSENLVLDQLII